MKITITQRIGAGFTLLVILMLVMSFSSHRAFTDLNSQVAKAGEEIAPMLTSSGNIGIALLSANKTLMQFLSTSDLQQMDQLKQAFAEQQEQYLSHYEQMRTLTANDQETSTQLSVIDQSSHQFYKSSEDLIGNHFSFAKAIPDFQNAFQNLDTILTNFQSELNDLVNYGDDHNEVSASSILAAQIVSLLEHIEKLKKSDLSTPLPDTYKAIELTLNAMQQRVERLATTNKETAAEFAENVNLIDQLIRGEHGMLPVFQQQQQQKQKASVLLDDLTLRINAATEGVNTLMKQVQGQAKAEQLIAADNAGNAQLTNLGIGLFSVIVAVIIALSVCQSIRRPLKEIMSILRVMADGDMTQRIKITSKDEFADLSNWVNQLAGRLKETIGEITQSSEEVADNIVGTAQLSEKNQGNMKMQSEQTSVVVSSINEMSGCVKEVAESAELAQQAVVEIGNNANINHQTMNDNIQLIQSLASKITEATDVIDHLNDRSNAIGQILEVIRDIAEQTNLLALNAAIEAARAGEQGRGFAVVADEVRTLASRTQNSTQEIQTIIQDLQSGATAAVEIMGSSREEVQKSVDGIEKAGEELTTIVTRLDDIRSMSEHIATAAEEQSYTCTEINSSVQKIADMTDDCANDSVKIVEKGEHMILLARQQQKLVAQFSID